MHVFMFMLYNAIWVNDNYNNIFSYNFYLNIQVAKNEELGLELVTLLNTKEKLQNDKEAVELETMQVLAKYTLFKHCLCNFPLRDPTASGYNFALVIHP